MICCLTNEPRVWLTLSDNAHTFYNYRIPLPTHLELHKCTVTSVSELAHSWGVFQYTVCSLVEILLIISVLDAINTIIKESSGITE